MGKTGMRVLGLSFQWTCLRLEGLGQGVPRVNVHRSHHPSQVTQHPHHCHPLCGSDHMLKTPTRHTSMHRLCSIDGGYNSVDQLMAPERRGNTLGPAAFSQHKSRHVALINSAVRKYSDSRKTLVVSAQRLCNKIL